MYPQPIKRLIELLSELPGLGPRQAARITFFILRESKGYSKILGEAIIKAKEDTSFCGECYRSIDRTVSSICEFCSSEKRNQETLAIVEKEVDLANLEKTRLYAGVYHILGGVFRALDPDSPTKLHLADLYSRIEKKLKTKKPVEIIIATSETTEGVSTSLYIERMLDPLKAKYKNLTVSRLGRGLSLGTELEYADEVTLQNALQHRTHS
ncbi:MAG: recombination protein RecR [Candidatus Sungbacteria bacterium]|uniref:Recombination protein RecR n=1 Tax=Candidatus Sungiibacteriota bacterium TaxID=2750080 RepID=A0A9D6QTM9_9BACT|nr:recombination protein RecR [Candidatus Sungbacteria bacterium]